MVLGTQEKEFQELQVTGARIPCAKVAYIILFGSIYFSGITPIGDAFGTAHMGEIIVQSICDALSLNWKEVMFFDIHTRTGYPSMLSGAVRAYQLILTEGRRGSPYIEHWEEVVSDYLTRTSFPSACPDILDGALKHFQTFIFPEC